jgi:hypothetical protein
VPSEPAGARERFRRTREARAKAAASQAMGS